MKYGLKHTRPSNDEIEEYLKKLVPQTKNTSQLDMHDYIDVISETIPKKIKKPEFQVINDSKKVEKADGLSEGTQVTSTNHQKTLSSPSSKGSAQFLYSSILNETSSTSPQDNILKIDEPKQVATLISSIKKEIKLDSRRDLSIALNNISNANCLTRFLQLNGPTHIGYWIDDYRDEIESNVSVDNRAYEILWNILDFCDRLPISVNDLKISKIGKKINKLGKCHLLDEKIKSKCEVLVTRWKKMIENLKDKKISNEEDRKEKDFKYSNEISPVKSYGDYLQSPNKQNINNSNYFSSENYSMLRKTQRNEIESANDKNYKKTRIQDSKSYEKETLTNYKNSYSNDQTRNSNMHEKNHNTELNFANQNKPQFNKQNVAVNQISRTTISNQFISSEKSLTKPQLPAKGILKKLDKNKKEKKVRVRWEIEEKMERVKVFKLTDEVEAPAVTEEEYQKIQIEILKNPNYKYLDDMRSKEINMEKENLSKAREKNKITKDLLYRMIPSMQWIRPYGKISFLNLELLVPRNNNNDPNDDDNNYLANNKGSESEEKNIINLLCQKILSVTYFRDSEIPDCPQMGPSKLFSFTDENIPKIENVKNLYNTDKPNPNAEIFAYIDNLSETKLTPEILSTISQKIENNHFTHEEKTKILDYLKRHLNKGKLIFNIYTILDSTQLPTPTATPINPQNIYLKNFVPQINPSAPLNPLNMNMNKAFNFNNGVNMPSMPIINPLNNNLNTPGSTMPMAAYGDKNLMSKPNDNRDQKMNPILNMNKIFTKPCRNYHGPNGCNRGDHCHFIHDPNFQGKDIPNFNLNNYRNYGHTVSEKRYSITNVNIVNNYGNLLENKEKEDLTKNMNDEMIQDERVKESNMVTPNSINTGSNMLNKEPNSNYMSSMNMNTEYMNNKVYQGNFNIHNKMMMSGYPMNPQINTIRPPFMNNINMKGNMNNQMRMNTMNNMKNMNMPMGMNNMPNMPHMSNSPNMPNPQNINANQPNHSYIPMQPNPFIFMNNYARMPFNMVPQPMQPNNSQSNNNQSGSTANK